MAVSAAQLVAIVTADTATAEANLRRVGSEFDRVGGQAGGMAGGLKALTTGFAVAGIAAAAFSVHEAMKFQSAMLMLQTQAGASAGEVKKMTAAVLDLAPAVGFGPTKLAESLYHIESIGLRGSKAMDVLRLASEGAKIGHADLEQTTNALTAAVASGMRGTQDYAAAMGKLNAIVGAGDMKMKDLNAAMSTGILVTMKQYGVSLDEVGAALATFGDNNIRGQAAATMLRMAVQALSSPAKGGATALASIGLNAQMLRDDLQKGGLNMALNDLHAGLVLSGKGGTEAGQLLTDAFGKRAGAGLQILNGQIDRFHQKLDIMSHTDAKAFGDAWAATQQTLAVQLDKVKASIEALAIKIGSVLLPIISRAIDWAMHHKKIMGELAFAIGVVLLGAIAALTVALLTNPFVLITVGAIALITELKHLWDTSRTARAVMSEVFAGMVLDARIAIGLILGTISTLVGALASFVDSIPGIPKSSKKGLDSAAETIKGFKDSTDKALADIQHGAQARSAATAISLTMPLADRLPMYRQIAEQYHVSLDKVLDDAGISAGDKAAIMGTNVTTHLQKTLIPGISAIVGEANGLGQNLVDGFAAGISSQTYLAVAAAGSMAASAVGATKFAIRAQSPSKVFHELGVNAGQGFANGITVAGVSAARAAEIMANQAAYAADAATKKAHKGHHPKAHHAHAAHPIRDVYGTYASANAKYEAEVARHNAAVVASHEAAADRIEKAHERAVAAAARAALKLGKESAKAAIEGAVDAANSYKTMTEADVKAVSAARKSMETDLAGMKKEADAFNDSLLKGITSGMGDVVGLFKDLTVDTTAAKQALDAANATVRKATSTYADLQAQQAAAKTTTVAQQQALEDAAAAVTDATTKATAAQLAYTQATKDAANPITLLTSTLQDQLAKTKKFGDDLSALTAAGASKDLISQLAKAGADSGDALAASLLAAGPGAVKNIDDLMSSIQTAGKTAADAITAQYYQAGEDSMQAQIDGMKSKEDALKAEVLRVQGILSALTDANRAVQSATNVAAINVALRNVGLSGPLAQGGSSTTVVNLHLDGSSIQAAVQTGASQVMTTVARTAATGVR